MRWERQVPASASCVIQLVVSLGQFIARISGLINLSVPIQNIVVPIRHATLLLYA
jgi:hypothetical protein